MKMKREREKNLHAYKEKNTNEGHDLVTALTNVRCEGTGTRNLLKTMGLHIFFLIFSWHLQMPIKNSTSILIT